MAKRWRRKKRQARKQARIHEYLVVEGKLSNTENSHKHDWKKEIKISQDYICPVCGKKGTDSSLDIHHCINRCHNGKNTKENCCAVHKKTCHVWIHQTYGNKYYDPRKK